jgi:hypothetical protein
MDLEIIKSKEYDISSTSSEFYKELMKYLIANGEVLICEVVL